MSTVMTEAAGRIHIVLGGGGGARLFGVPFLLAGLWLGYYLLLGLMSFVKGTSSVDMVPGTLVLIVMTAAFFLPGWMLVAARAVVEIDLTRGTVSVVRDLRFYQRRHERRLSEFSVIEVDLLSTAPTKRTSRAFQVELASESRDNQVVGLFDDGEAALKHGRQLSALVGLPLVDRRYTEPPADE
jgi:hypothetical protein